MATKIVDACPSAVGYPEKSAERDPQLPRAALSPVVFPSDLENLHMADCRVGICCYSGCITVQSKDRI